MKKLAVFLAIVALLLIVIGCQSEVKVTRVITEKETVVETVEVTPAFDPEAEKEKVEAVHDAIFEAFANEDRETVRRFYHPDYTFHFSDANRVVDMVLGDWINTFPAQTFVLEDPEWIVITPDLAVRTGYGISWVGLEVPDKGAEMHFVTMIHKKQDGQWLLLHVHRSRSERKWNGP